MNQEAETLRRISIKKKTNENDLLAVNGVPLLGEGNECRECLFAANNTSAICGPRSFALLMRIKTLTK